MKLSILLFSLNLLYASDLDCSLHLTEQSNFSKMIHSRNSKFHMSPEVLAEHRRRKTQGLEVSQNPSSKISNFFDALERIHNRAKVSDSAKARLRNYYYDQFIIKPDDIPEAYFKNQQRIARERGHGDVQITQSMRDEATQTLIADQQQSLNSWFDYFLSSDSDNYPFYAKYWSFTGMLKLSKFEVEKGVFF